MGRKRLRTTDGNGQFATPNDRAGRLESKPDNCHGRCKLSGGVPHGIECTLKQWDFGCIPEGAKGGINTCFLLASNAD